MKSKLKYCFEYLQDHYVSPENYYKAEREYEEKYNKSIYTLVDFNRFIIKKEVEH